MFKKLFALFVLLFVLPAQSATKDPVKVIASFSVIADMVEQVGGDAVEVYSLAGKGVDAHTFRPTPKAVATVKKSDVLFMNGLGFETWMPRVIEASGFTGDVVVLGDAIDAIEVSEEDAHHHHHHSEGHDHHEKHSHIHHDEHKHEGHQDHHDKHDGHKHHDNHDEEKVHKKNHGTHHHKHAESDSEKVFYDPHAWQDLSNAIQYVDVIAETLIKKRPSQKNAIKARAAAYKASLAAVDAQFKARTKNVPKALKTAVTDHNAFAYFSRAYGVEFFAVRGLSTESAASAKDVSRVIRMMKEKKVKLIFLEAMTNTKLSKQIAKEANVKLAGQLYTGVLAPSGSASTYLGMMTHNLNTVAEGLESLP